MNAVGPTDVGRVTQTVKARVDDQGTGPNAVDRYDGGGIDLHVVDEGGCRSAVRTGGLDYQSVDASAACRRGARLAELAVDPDVVSARSRVDDEAEMVPLSGDVGRDVVVLALAILP